MRDDHNRTIDYIRLSVTDRCNLRCMYCMPKEGVESVPHGEILKFEEILRLCGAFARLGVKKFKVTGGEPLVRMGAVGFIGELKKLAGVEKVTVTTNGELLERHLDALTEAGVDGINISLDTLDPAVYKTLTGSDGHAKVMSALAACAERLPVKVNCVPIVGVNDRELADIAALARDTALAVRFIELMPVGLGARYKGVPSEQVKAVLEARYGELTPCGDRLGNGPARYYSVDRFDGRIGMIDAMSRGFCDKCNRMRLTSEGRLKLCLAHDDSIDLRGALRGGAPDDELAAIISGAVKLKPGMHGLANAAHEVGMNSIGG